MFRNHWHPEFESLDPPKGRYIPKAMRPEDFMRKKGLGRRYNKFAPKLTVPLEDAAAQDCSAVYNGNAFSKNNIRSIAGLH